MEGRRVYVKHSSYYSIDTSVNFRHHGTKGMKWYHRLYQYEDGTLTPLGKIRYRTGNKYKLMSDSEIQAYTNRKRLEKNASDIEKETSKTARLKSKLGSALEDVAVNTAKNAVSKIVGHYVDEKLSDILNKDKNEVKQEREEAARVAKEIADSLTLADIKIANNDANARRSFIENITGEKYKGPLEYRKTEDIKGPEDESKKKDPVKTEAPKPAETEAPKHFTERIDRKPAEASKDTPAPAAPAKPAKAPETKPTEKPKPADKTIPVKRDPKSSGAPTKEKESKPKYSNAVRNAALGMWRRGDNLSDISKRLGIPESTIKYIVEEEGGF